MNSPERLRATFERRPLDHLVRKEFESELGDGIWPAAMNKWQAEEGMPAKFDPVELFRYDPPAQHMLSTGALSGHAPLVPTYEPEVIDDLGDRVILRDTEGRLLKVFKSEASGQKYTFMPEYVQGAITGRESWEGDVKPRLDPDTPARWTRFAESVAAARAAQQEGLMTLQVVVGGYMFLRTLFGPVDLLYAFHDAPDLVHDVLDQWADLCDAVLERIQAEVEIDQILSGDDTCYKGGLLISPAMFREFLLPRYLRVFGNARRRQKHRLYLDFDSDGYLPAAIPLYLEAGADILGPFEVAAGCDVVAVGKAYPNLILEGGIDKRALAAGPDAIEENLKAIVPAMVRRGGYIPTCDHYVPSDVTYSSYLYYRRRICELDH